MILIFLAVGITAVPAFADWETPQTKEAIAKLEQNLGDPEVMNETAEVFYRNGHHRDAVEIWLALIKYKPNMAEPYYFMGQAHYDKGNTLEAIEMFQKAISREPTHAKAYHRLGLAYREQGNIQAAIRNYRESIRFDPDLPELHDDLGMLLLDTDEINPAIEQFRHEIKLQPKYAQVRMNLGVALIEKKKYDQAIQSFQDFIRLTPSNNVLEIAEARGLINKARSLKAIEGGRIRPVEVKDLGFQARLILTEEEAENQGFEAYTYDARDREEIVLLAKEPMLSNADIASALIKYREPSLKAMPDGIWVTGKGGKLQGFRYVHVAKLDLNSDPILEMTLTYEAKRKFRDFMRQNLGRKLIFMGNNRILMKAAIKEPDEIDKIYVFSIKKVNEMVELVKEMGLQLQSVQHPVDTPMESGLSLTTSSRES